MPVPTSPPLQITGGGFLGEALSFGGSKNGLAGDASNGASGGGGNIDGRGVASNGEEKDWWEGPKKEWSEGAEAAVTGEASLLTLRSRETEFDQLSGPVSYQGWHSLFNFSPTDFFFLATVVAVAEGIGSETMGGADNKELREGDEDVDEVVCVLVAVVVVVAVVSAAAAAAATAAAPVVAVWPTSCGGSDG